jgi:hypothetical protein
MTALWFVLWFGAMAVIMRWLQGTRLTPRAGQSASMLQHPRSVLVIGLVCSGFFVVIAILSVAFPDKDGPSAGITLGLLAFSLLGLPLIAEYYRVWHRLEPGGMRSQPLLREACSVRWKDVRRVNYSQAMKWFVVETPTGAVVRVSVMLTGLPSFARTVLHEVPRERIDPAAVPFLERTAAGNPPPIWM